MKRFFYQLFISVAVAQSAVATVRYASPVGNDVNGTSAEQPGALAAMISKLSAGDTLYLLDGQYNLKENLKFSKTGTADHYITIAAAEGAKPVLDFREEPNGTNGITVGGAYIHLRDLTIRYAGKKGLWLEGASYCILERLVVYGCCDSGIQLRKGGYNMVINCDSYDNFDYQANGGNADGFADKQGGAAYPGNIYIGCRAWGNSDDGWDSYERITDGTPTVYINCICYKNSPATFDLTNHPRVLGVDKELSCFKGKDLSKMVASKGNPNGFKLGGNSTKHHTELYRCLSVGHRGKGFDQNSNAGQMLIVNCTAYDNNRNYYFYNNNGYHLTIHNSISLAPQSKDGFQSDVTTESHNSWSKGFTVSADNFESLDVANLILAPRQPDGSLPLTPLLRLKSTATNLIDRGMVFNGFSGDFIGDYVTYAGQAPDLGCYEYADVSGIFQIERSADTLSVNAPRYDLQGRRVDASYHGIVVRQGRKYVQ